MVLEPLMSPKEQQEPPTIDEKLEKYKQKRVHNELKQAMNRSKKKTQKDGEDKDANTSLIGLLAGGEDE